MPYLGAGQKTDSISFSGSRSAGLSRSCWQPVPPIPNGRGNQADQGIVPVDRIYQAAQRGGTVALSIRNVMHDALSEPPAPAPSGAEVMV